MPESSVVQAQAVTDRGPGLHTDIAAKFCWPELLGTVPYLSYGRLRPLHVNGMLFGWLLAADMGLTFYMVPRLCGVKLWSEKLGIATALLWNIIILGAVVSLL